MKRPAGRVSRALFSVMVSWAILPLWSGCTTDSLDPEGNPGSASGRLVAATECKTGVMGLGPAAPSTLDCLGWEHDGNGTLRLTHVNAGLNCCPGTIQADFEIDGNSIVITPAEGEDGIPCRCLCLYDLSYEITGIAAEEYTITVVEQYLDEEDEPLTITVDFSIEPQGTHCVERAVYPWGLSYVGTEPVGVISSRGVCKEFHTVEESLPPADDPAFTCIYGWYVLDESGGTLTLSHTNAAFNCCVDVLDADFAFGPGTIEITEREIPEGGLCDCICLYDVHYALFNIEPGTYTIRFVEPYVPPDREPLEFTVDLTETMPIVHCIPRDFYPWNAGASEDDDREILDRLFTAILEYVGTPYCSDCEECRVIGYGAKPCGGPWGYLIYSSSTLDERVLQGLVSAHRSFEAYMNAKYGYSSTCDVPPVPAVTCIGGQCRAAP